MQGVVQAPVLVMHQLRALPSRSHSSCSSSRCYGAGAPQARATQLTSYMPTTASSCFSTNSSTCGTTAGLRL